MKLKNNNSLDTAVFTTKFVLEDKNPITYVTHDIEDGAWQFFSDDDFDNLESVARIVGLNEILDLDPTLKYLSNMESGYEATRRSINDTWVIKKMN